MPSLHFIPVMLLAAGVALVGGWMLWRGWRGKRQGDRAFCRRCGYDVTSRPSGSERCSECGADLCRPRGVRIGQRVRSVKLMLAGSLVMLLAIAAGIVATASHRGKINPIEYLPLAYLKYLALHSGDQNRRDSARYEIARRLFVNRMSDAQLLDLCQIGLAQQADYSRPWDWEWGYLVEGAHTKGILSASDWARYARQAFDLKLKVRPTISVGNYLPMEIAENPSRVYRATFWADLVTEEFRCDGVFVDCDVDPDRRDAMYVSSDFEGMLSGQSRRYLQPTTAQSSRIAHAVDLKLQLAIREGLAGLNIPRNDPALTTDQRNLSATFNLVQNESQANYETHDAKLRDAVRGGITISPFHRDKLNAGLFTAELETSGSPVPLCCDIWVRFPDGSVFKISDWYGYSGRDQSNKISRVGFKDRQLRRSPIHFFPTWIEDSLAPIGLKPGGSLGYTMKRSPLTVDFYFKADPESARLEMNTVWGEDIFIPDIPVLEQ